MIYTGSPPGPPTGIPGGIPQGPAGSGLLWEDALLAGVRSRRCLGWLIDLLLVGLLVGTLWASLLLLGLLTFGLGWWLLGLVPLAPFAYHCLFLTSSMSATPGQAMFGLVVRRDDDLGPPSLAQAVISTLLFYLTLATSGLLLLVALFTQRKRTLHDLASGLVVVRRRAWHEWALETGALTGGSGSWNMPPGHPYA
jgi:uncharacterized RDD family membrane protein YckC